MSLIQRIKGKAQGACRLAKLTRVYGPLYPFTRTGRLRVFEYSFPFYSFPQTYYLEWNVEKTCYEPGLCQHLIRRFQGRAITFLDIGAHYGIFSALLGAMNSENRVYAFEPNPESFQTLKKNWDMNCRHGGCFQLALSDAEGSIPFHDKSMKVGADETGLRVPAIRFDEWRKTHPVQPDLVKLDVHGGEGLVLCGMQELLREGGFDIYFELHPQDILVKYTLKEIIALLYDNAWQMAELPDFRSDTLCEPVKLTPERRADLEDPARWTPQETSARRMFYCTQRGATDA